MDGGFTGFAVVVCALSVTACGVPGTPSSSRAGGYAGTSVGGAAGNGGTNGGSAGTSGTGPGPGSIGCGATSWPEGDQRLYAILVDGTQREYIVTIPESYDPNHPHRLVLTWHDRGVKAEEVAFSFGGTGYFGLAGLIGDSTILVSGQGLGTESDEEDTGWPNTDGRDLSYVRAVLEWLNESYCIDQDRIFSTGVGEGGNLSLTIGCQMGDVFRGIAPVAGALSGDLETSCNPGPVAFLQIHGTADDVITMDYAERARDAFLLGNHCGTTTQPLASGPCVAYDGCDTGYPVVWCVHEGGHVIPGFASGFLALLFEQL